MSIFWKGDFKMFGMIGQDERNYTNEVRNYVNGILNSSLLAGVEGNPTREHNNLVLLQKLLADEEARNEIVERITNRGIKSSMPSYKPNLLPAERRTVFMRQIYSFLDVYQVSLLAIYFDKQIEQEKLEKHSR